MKAAGQITLLSLPRTDFRTGKRRPALLLARVPGAHDDWIVAMISSQLGQQVADFDEVIRPGDADFASSGLKQESLIRVGRVAVVASEMMPGTIGEIGQDRLQQAKMGVPRTRIARSSATVYSLRR